MPGPPPKPANKRARRNKDLIEQRVVQAVPSGQPGLPDDVDWPEQTLEWWSALGRLPQTAELSAVQWDHLAMIAMIHADVWGNRNLRSVPVYQKAMAEYPILPATMLRMRVTALTGDEMVAKKQTAESKTAAKAKKSYGQLKAVS